MSEQISEKVSGIVQKAGGILYRKKAQDIRAFSIGHMTVLADAMIFASGRTTVQVKALSDEVEEKLAEDGLLPLHREGYTDGRWIVLDYGDVLVHILHQDDREYYRLERLWDDGSNEIRPSWEGEAE